MKKTKTEAKTQTAVPAAPAVPAPKEAGLKKFNLGGIAAKPATGKPVKTYPVLPDPDGQIAELVGSILERAAQVEALEGALELDKSELIVLAKQFYFAHYSGQMAVASSVEARNGEKVVRVGFSNSYRGTSDDAAILRVSGEKGAKFFKQSFELKIKGDLIPEASVEPLIGELQELFTRHNAGAALSAKAVFKPSKEFHTARHTLFSPDENLAIDKVVPISASVKTKLGRGGSDDE
jgi:hypothetical protein